MRSPPSTLPGTAGSIGRRFGIADGTVFHALNRKGVARRNRGAPITWEDNEQNRRELVAAYEAGNGITALARKFRINKRRVTQVLEESGIAWRHPGGTRQFSDEQAAEIIRSYLAGEGVVQLGVRHDVSAKVIRNYLKRANVTLRSPGVAPFWTDDRRAEAMRRYQAGENLGEIAAALGCPIGPLSRVLQSAGLLKPIRAAGSGDTWIITAMPTSGC